MVTTDKIWVATIDGDFIDDYLIPEYGSVEQELASQGDKSWSCCVWYEPQPEQWVVQLKYYKGGKLISQACIGCARNHREASLLINAAFDTAKAFAHWINL